MSVAEGTAEVIGRHLQAFLAGDIEALMADFADDALLCTPDGALRGHGPIRGFFEWALPLLPAGATTVEVKQQIVDGEVFYVAWSASSPAVAIPFAIDVFIVRDGKLAYQCFAARCSPSSRSRSTRALAAPPQRRASERARVRSGWGWGEPPTGGL